MFETRILPFDEYEIKNLITEQLALFVCSTANEGEEPNQMRQFWRFIMKRGLPSHCLASLNFGLIALGDSAYRRFAVIGKKLSRRLINLGAKQLLSLCVGDDQHDLGYEATVSPWLQQYFKVLNQNAEIALDPITKQPIPFKDENELPLSTFEIVFLNDVSKEIRNIESKTRELTLSSSSDSDHKTHSNDESLYMDFSPESLEEADDSFALLHSDERENVHKKSFQVKNDFDERNPYWARIISNERISDASHFQETRLMKLNIPVSKMPHQPGDVLNVCALNRTQEVHTLLKLFGLTGNEKVQIVRKRAGIGGRSVYDAIKDRVLLTSELFARYVNINVRPKQGFFELLWRVSSNDLEREKLKHFASEAGLTDLCEYVTKPRRTAIEVMTDFINSSSAWPRQRLLDLLPCLQPRMYSIASYSGTRLNELQILYSVVDYKTRMKTPRFGVCTSYMRTLKAGQFLPCFVRSGVLKLPPDSKTPIILIGTGTGVAPLRSLIEQRVENNISNNFLFFGCRGRSLDMYFADEWAELNARGLLYYYTAFSRQQPNPAHVQHRLWEQRQLLWHLIASCDAHVYIAGRTGPMPRDVRATLLRMLKDQGADQLPEDQAEVLMDRLEQKGRIQYECWS